MTKHVRLTLYPIELFTSYEPLRNFARSIVALAQGQATEAILPADKG